MIFLLFVIFLDVRMTLVCEICKIPMNQTHIFNDHCSMFKSKILDSEDFFNNINMNTEPQNTVSPKPNIENTNEKIQNQTQRNVIKNNKKRLGSYKISPERLFFD
ncbi:hypothetical protein CWI36_0317p0030 [Hamiltosporidium magnivora]|uniref:Uncharacterized protein n=1 Tax=Hamiltosporidium magnivora TaxID=148818 RepID=A0A4Q9LGT8_9MICR|nr:hypothetical protein CWI36_0317p0030 [Hamiltosporidium magnivora]